MGTLICNATGNLTGAATFAAAEVGTGALNLVRNTVGVQAAAQVLTTPSFTVTTGKVIDGVLLWVSQQTAGPTGTFKVDLQKGGVSQASVTVNKADLPVPPLSGNNTPPVFFRFTSTATGDGGANWTLVVTTTGTVQVNYWATAGTAGFFSRALRTTTAATPAAADDLYVVGELTGAGTNTSRTVTMNSTAATAYGNGALNTTSVAGGGIHVSNYGTLSYGITAATNYILRINGDLSVYAAGTLNIGSSGAEIPRNSSAVLEFQQVSADGDFGLRCIDYSTVNIAGLSRTSGKNVVKCKLTADVASSNLLSTFSTFGMTTFSAALDASGNSLLACSLTENSSASTHYANFVGTIVSNTTQTASVWLAQGTGTNNRYVRFYVGNNSALASLTNGFYSDIDLQAGTAGTVTAVGTGTATSVSITASGRGWLVRMTGKVSSGSATSNVILAACSAPGTTSYTGTGTQNFIFDHIALVTAASIADTTFNVDTDTGWLNGDAVCAAATTRTAAECTIYSLNNNAGASSFTSALYPFSSGTVNPFASTHHGTSPVQAEIGLLTRNVKIRSTSNTLMSYVYCAALATVTASWAEFYYVGHISAGKRGIEVDGGAICNPKSFTYCSLHDLDNYGFVCNAVGASLNVTFSNNVIWNNYTSQCVYLNGGVTNNDWTFDSNLMVRIASYGFLLNDLGGICSNNTVIGAGNVAFYLSGSVSLEVLGNLDGNTAHSNTNIGLALVSHGITGTINNFTAWRNNNSGVSYQATVTAELVFTNLTLFGNSAGAGQGQFNIGTGDIVTIRGGVIAGDTSFPTAAGITISPLTTIQFNLSNVDMSGVGSIYAPHTTNDIYIAGTFATLRGVFNNCKFGATNPLAAKSLWTKSAFMSFEKYNQVAGDHRTEMTYGQLKTDSAIYNTAAPSMRMTPNTVGSKLESAPVGLGVRVPVNNGAAVTASVLLRKDTTYTGNQPRLIARANAAIGINTDTVLATYSAGTGTWNSLSGTTATATDDGAVDFVVDCDGAAGFINLDDWTFAGAATNASGMNNWYGGLPAIGGGGGGGGGSFSGGFF